MEIVLRIHAGNGAFDWKVLSSQVTFRDALELIQRYLPNCLSTTAFEYEDEDGDRITVRSEEEMANMVAFHVSNVDAGQPNFIVIYPRGGKPPGKRNIHNLKVNTTPVTGMTTQNIPLDHSSGSRKQQTQDLQEILSAGATLQQSDLQLHDVLGVGNAGTVWKAIHQSSRTAMAVKIMKLDITDLAETQKKIMSELQVLYKCRSSVIIAFYGAFFVENTIHICTEFMDGGSLDKYGQITENVLGRMTVSMVSGLQYLWSLKIMHRDVKPSNVLVNTQGQVKLCDFGVSVQLAESVAKTVIGTHAYMSPERILGKDYSVYSDVWSLGISLYELAVGRFPYQTVYFLGERGLRLAFSKKPSALALFMTNTMLGLSLNQDDETNKPMELVKSIVYGDPPKLPPGTVSCTFEDFIHHCIIKESSQRPLPKALMSHPLIAEYNDGNTEIVAQWVCKKLVEIQNRVQPTTENLECHSLINI